MDEDPNVELTDIYIRDAAERWLMESSQLS